MTFSLGFPRSLRARVLLFVALPTLVELLLVVKLTSLQVRAENSLKSGQHYSEVLKALNALNVEFMQSNVEFMSAKLEKRSMHGILTSVSASIRAVALPIQQLRALIKDEPEAVNLLNRVVSLRDAMAQNVRSFASGWVDGTSNVEQRAEESRRLNLLAKKGISALVQLQTDVEEILYQRYAQSIKFKSEERTVLISLALLNAFLCIVAIFALSTAASKRLQSLLLNMRKYAAGEALTTPEPGSDEIAFIEDVFYKAAEELRSAQRKEQAFIDESHDPIIFVGEDLRIIFANNSAQKNYGMTVGLRLSERVSSIDEARTFLKDVQKGQLKTTQIEVLANEERRAAILSAAWEPAAHCYFCIIHDISERIQIEQMRTDLVSMFTHDLKSPLTALRLNLDLVADETLSENQSQHLDKAFDSIARMSNLVTDLLDLYKSEAGMMNFAREIFDARKLADSVKDEFATIAASLHVEVVVRSDQSHNLFARGSLEASRRVLSNLLGNALKFSPEKETVSIELRTVENRLLIDVADAGPGISEENLPFLFDRFHQFSAATNSRNSTYGSGLGLAICRTFAEQQGGNVSVKSKIGKGSIFTFSLPAAEAE